MRRVPIVSFALEKRRVKTPWVTALARGTGEFLGQVLAMTENFAGTHFG